MRINQALLAWIGGAGCMIYNSAKRARRRGSDTVLEAMKMKNSRLFQKALDGLIEKIGKEYPEYLKGRTVSEADQSTQNEMVLRVGGIVLRELGELYLTVEHRTRYSVYHRRLWLVEPDICGGHADISSNILANGTIFVGELDESESDASPHPNLYALADKIVERLGHCSVERHEDKSENNRCVLYVLRPVTGGDQNGQ
jgi:hypothetical protein